MAVVRPTGIDVKFIREKDYVLKNRLGSGACGETVLLYDDTIEEYFVCKKFAPHWDGMENDLFERFSREIKLLMKLSHKNIVRIFNHYLYQSRRLGYIIMEYVDGVSIHEYIKKNPAQISSLFEQALDGFCYLEAQRILHRDIRPQNLLVSRNGLLKIIDFGFGKQASTETEYEESVRLNHSCELPEESDLYRYDFRTEVYYLGQLFRKYIGEYDISTFGYNSILNDMCQAAPDLRIQSFRQAKSRMAPRKFVSNFSVEQVNAYRSFADSLCNCISKIESGTIYKTDLREIEYDLEREYEKFLLEYFVPNSRVVIKCILSGSYFRHSHQFLVSSVADFLTLLGELSERNKSIVFSNLHGRLDAIPRYSDSDDIPF